MNYPKTPQTLQMDLLEKPVGFDKWRCRCSGINMMMSQSKENAPLTELQVKELEELDKKPNRTEKQGIRMTELIQKRENSKNVVLGDTCISFLLEEYAWITEKKCSITKELDVVYLQKGRLGEKEGRELLSYIEDYYYEKNEERLYNDFLSGEPDTWKGKHIRAAEAVPDLKVIWDLPGFLKKIVKPIEPEYADQLRGYGSLTRAKTLFRANALITTPESIRNQIKMKLFYKRDYATPEAPEFLKEWEPVERSMIFEGMPHHKRLHRLYVDPFTPQQEQAVYDRVKVAREWLNNFHEKYQKLNK